MSCMFLFILSTFALLLIEIIVISTTIFNTMLSEALEW